MRFDDKLATVLAQPLTTAAERSAAWRQVVDILAQAHQAAQSPLSEQARDLLRELRAEVPAEVRADAARAVAGRRVHPDVVALIAEEPASISAPLIRGARLEADEWLRLLPRLSPTARALLRHRRDLDREVVRGLTSFGPSDFVLGSDVAAIEPATAAAETVLTEGETQIRDLLARIAAYRREEPPARAAADEPDEPAYCDEFRFETGSDGVILWIEGAPRGPLIGETIATAALSDHGVDGHAAGAFRRRSPFRDARLSVAGSGAAAGDWRISAVPFFDPRDGRFTGYRGTARRPRADERAAPVGERPGLYGSPLPADSLRQLVHELRTPLNAIVGFGEMIERQMLGPAALGYRSRAAEIVNQGRRLLAAVDDLDMAARLEQHRFEAGGGPVDAVMLLARLRGDYQAAASARGVVLDFRLADDLPPIEADPVAVERMFARLLAATIGLAGANETISAQLGHEGERLVSLTVSRPRLLEGRDERTLLDPGYSPDGDWPDAPLLGLGFALRLIRNLALSAHGALDILPASFVLSLPARDRGAATGQGKG